MYQAEDYQRINSQRFIYLQLILKSLLLLFFLLYLIDWLQLLSMEFAGSLLSTAVITYRARADVSISKEKFEQLKSSSLQRGP